MSEMPGKPVAVPLPPSLAEVFGYRGDARYVGFCFTPLGDDVVYSDGRGSGSGATWAYLSFKRHRAVEPFLRDADLGSSEEDGTQMLLIDNHERKASVAPLHDARTFLDSQWPVQEAMTPEQEELFRAELDQLMEEQRSRPIDWDAITRRQREQSTRMAVMLAYLDQQVPPSQGQMP